VCQDKAELNACVRLVYYLGPFEQVGDRVFARIDFAGFLGCLYDECAAGAEAKDDDSAGRAY
jgi:hypothetical protein